MSRKRLCLRIGSVAAIISVVFLAAAKSNASAGPDNALDLLVISKATEEPIADAEINISIMQQKSKDKTDEQGRCSIVLGEKQLDYLRVEVRKESFVPIRLAWRQSQARTGIPGQYTLALEPGTSIGGIIRDEHGNPVKGVRVRLLVPGGDEVEGPAIWDHVEKTDADGRWRCDIVPSKLNDVWIRLSHPDYISDEMYGKTPKPPMEKLRDMTGVMVMKQGLSVGGRVLDSDGRPIEGASVAQGSTRFAHYPTEKTDSEGTFEFVNARPGEMVLTVQAKGHSPDLKEFTVHKSMEPLEFRLGPGHTIRGQIVDTAGNPVAGAFVAAATWREHRSLKWRVNTDAEGRFHWNDAPADEVLIDMGKQRFMSVRKYGMSPSEEEYLVTMPPELKINGKVVDAETGEPIPEFKVLSGIDWGPDRSLTWQRSREKTFTQGHYEVAFTYPYPAHLIRIEAEGYEPGVSRPIGSDEGQVTFDARLKKGTGPTGIVRLPNGEPASEAEVILCTASRGVYIRNGRNRQSRDSQFVETKKDGKFSFPVQTDIYTIVVLHNDGYAEVKDEELAESSELTLQPWARVEGKVLIGKDPGADESVNLGFDRPSDRNAPRVSYDYRAVTDSEGNFVLERVPPGKARISRMIKITERSSRYSHGTPLEIKPGETTNVTIGGTGRSVIGKIAIPDYLKDKFDWQHTNYGVKVNSPENPYRQLGFTFEPDGSFRIDDVPAGDYSLYVDAYEPPSEPRAFRGKKIGAFGHDFSISEMPGGRSDIPLDLGVLKLEDIGGLALGRSLVGKPLPDLGGMMIDLPSAQTKGNMILTCFWDMSQRPSRNCLRQLTKRAQELRGRNVLIAAVHASKVDETALNEWVKKNNTPFPVGMVEGDAKKTRFTWGVRSLPWLILTDSRHVVIAEGFGLSELDAKIKQINGD